MLNACEKFESCVGVSLSSSCSGEQQPMLHIQTHTCWRHHQLSCLALIIHHDQHESFRDSIVYQLFRNQISVFRVISSTLPWPLYPRRKIVTFPLGVFHCYCGYLNICQHQKQDISNHAILLHDIRDSTWLCKLSIFMECQELYSNEGSGANQFCLQHLGCCRDDVSQCSLLCISSVHHLL